MAMSFKVRLIFGFHEIQMFDQLKHLKTETGMTAKCIIRDYLKISAGIFILVWLTGCGTQDSYYLTGQIDQVRKIDAHVHINHDTPVFIDEAKRFNFRLLTINVDYPDFPALAVQERIAIESRMQNPGTVAFAATFAMDGWGDPDWEERVTGHIDTMLSDGACGVKVWKNIGMDFRDQLGELVMIDDPGFDPVFRHILSKNTVLIGHMGEPRSCWLPADEIPIKYIRDYFKDHPEYHMYLHPEMPSYQDQMQARDGMLEKNRDIEFVGAHLASLEWSVDEIARFLDHFPKADVDMAARMGNIQYQAAQDHQKVRRFFMDYQDRILYATDLVHAADTPEADLLAEMRRIWQEDWKFMTSDSLMTNSEFAGSFTGLHLPAPVIDKIYYHNAVRKFGQQWP